MRTLPIEQLKQQASCYLSGLQLELEADKQNLAMYTALTAGKLWPAHSWPLGVQQLHLELLLQGIQINGQANGQNLAFWTDLTAGSLLPVWAAACP